MSDRASPFHVTYSTLSAAALLTELLPDFQISQPIDCVLLSRSVNDTYLVTTADGPYALRVYRAAWRPNREHVLWEVDVLNHLDRQGAAVSAPVPLREGGFVRSLLAPEGARHAVLFNYAPGHFRWPPWTDEQLRRFGGILAEIHGRLDDFTSGHDRFTLDLDHLLTEPLAALMPVLAHRPGDGAALHRLADDLRHRLMALPSSGLTRGICHGDSHAANVHIADDGTMTIIDFDCAGPGWLAYDLAIFRWDLAHHDDRDAAWETFLEGYTRRRELAAIDLAAVPVLVAIRHLWLVGMYALNAPDWGMLRLNDRFFDRELGFLRRWVAEQL